MFTYQRYPTSSFSPFLASPSYDYVPCTASRYAHARARAEAEHRERERLAHQRYFSSPQYNPYNFEEDEGDADVFVPQYGYREIISPRELAYLHAQKQWELEQERRREAQEEFLHRLYTSRRQPSEPRSRKYPTKSRGPATSTQIPINTPSPSVSPVGATSSSDPISPPISSGNTVKQSEFADEIKGAAAQKIQAFYRTHRALQAVAHIRRELDTLKSSFNLPHKVDFVIDEQTLSVDVPSNLPDRLDSDEDTSPAAAKLAYNSTNAPLHAYHDKLQKLLSKLDSVSTEFLVGEGRKRVRDARREVVRDAEREAVTLEKWAEWVWNSREKAVKEDVPVVQEPSMDVDVEESRVHHATVDMAGSNEMSIAEAAYTIETPLTSPITDATLDDKPLSSPDVAHPSDFTLVDSLPAEAEDISADLPPSGQPAEEYVLV